MQVGIDPLKIGEYTPYEITLLGKQSRVREQKEFESLVCLAWHTEAFARQKRLPNLNKLLKDLKKPRTNKGKSDAILKAMAAEKGIILD